MKKIFISAAVVAASVFGVYTANQNNAKANLSALELDDVEVLAEGENLPVDLYGKHGANPNLNDPGNGVEYSSVGPSMTGPTMAPTELSSSSTTATYGGGASGVWKYISPAQAEYKRTQTVNKKVLFVDCQNANSQTCQPHIVSM